MKVSEMKKGRSVADLNIEYGGTDFGCNSKLLTSLKGSPQVVYGHFDCSSNYLTSLEGAPQEVGGDFNCSTNRLETLKGGPVTVKGGYFCSQNRLTTLEGAPALVDGEFNCFDNELKTLIGGPQQVGGSFVCSQNELTALEGAPKEIGWQGHGTLYCYGNKLTSLKDIHKHIRRINGSALLADNEIQSHVLGLLLIKGLEYVTLSNKEVERIIIAHLDGGSMRSAMDCQHALIKAGFPEYAKL